jgi:hypothetical protein
MRAPPESLHFGVRTFADLRRPRALARVGRALDAEPALRFEKLGRHERGQVAVESLERALGDWRPTDRERAIGMDIFLSRRKVPRADGFISVTNEDPTKQVYAHSVYGGFEAAWFERDAARLELFVEFFRRLVGATRAFYGSAAYASFYNQQAALMARARGLFARPPILDRELTDVYWLMFLGPAYLARFGDRLRGLGVSQTPIAGGILIRTTERPTIEVVDATTDYAFKQPFYDALGKDTFYWEGQEPAAEGERVPTFDEHRRAAGRDVN